MDDQPHRPFAPSATDRSYGNYELHEPELPLPLAEPPRPVAPVRRRSRLGTILMLLVVVLIVAGIVAWVKWKSAHQAAPAGRFQSASQPVGVAKVAKGDMPVTLTALGTITPLATVTVQSQINGQLIEVGYKEGQMVKKGDFLAQIDPRPYQVALQQAQAQLAKDQAALKNAQVDLERYRKLVAENSIARQTLDTQVATVQQDAAVLQADQAQIDTQKLNLAYCHITAPVSGRVGLRLIDPGNYVQASSTTGLVVITQLQPISVVFTLPEDSLSQVLEQMRAGKTLRVTAFDRTGATKLDVGHLETVDNQIDTTTGTVKLRAVFDNPDQALFPNQFVNIQLLITTLENAPIVPNAAVQRGAPGTFVYIVQSDSTVKAQPVTLGPSDQQNIAVTKGVQDGEQVVTDGADRLKDGAKVRVTDDAAGGNGNQGAAGQGQGNGGKGAGATAAGQAPAGQAPAGQAPAGQAPAGQAPAGQAPTGQAPTDTSNSAQGASSPNDSGQGNASPGNAPSGNAPLGNAAPGNPAPPSGAPQSGAQQALPTGAPPNGVSDSAASQDDAAGKSGGHHRHQQRSGSQ